MARALIAALRSACLGEVFLASRLRSRDPQGDAAVQQSIIQAAVEEMERLSRGRRPSLWLTYHSYYKAPDLLGPALSAYWNIPYVLVEATRATSRLAGPYAEFAKAAEKACDAADLIFYLTEYDREALERDRVPGQQLVMLRPFLEREDLAPPPRRPVRDTTRLLACGMFRSGDKLASYAALAGALAKVASRAWTLSIVGDGPMRGEVEALFGQFGEQVTLRGALDPEGVREAYRNADMLVWPGVGEAFGMVYLEAQAEACAALAEDRPGVRDVVADAGWLTPAGDAGALARAIDEAIADPEARIAAGLAARQRVDRDHLLGSARSTLVRAITPLLQDQGS